LPIVIPAVTFVSVIESDRDEGTNVKGSLGIFSKNHPIFTVEVPITFVNGQLARVLINFQGIPVREAGPLTFRLTIPNAVTAETAFQVSNLAQHEAIQVSTPSTQV
jgi:hypothetical protein